jgi:hypothetical protein
MWHERVDVLVSRVFISAKTVCHCLHRRHDRKFGKAYVLHFSLAPRSDLAYGPAEETLSQRLASYALIAVTSIVTFIAAWYILRELNRVKPAVIYDRRKAR